VAAASALVSDVFKLQMAEERKRLLNAEKVDPLGLHRHMLAAGSVMKV
jgi:hypothetical protein